MIRDRETGRVSHVWYTTCMYHNWLRNLHRLMPKIIDKLLSGEDIGRLVIAIVATIVAYLLIDFVVAPVMVYLTSSDQEFNLLWFLVASGSLVCAVVVAWINFARWISDHNSQTDAEIIADAKIETMKYTDATDDFASHKK